MPESTSVFLTLGSESADRFACSVQSVRVGTEDAVETLPDGSEALYRESRYAVVVDVDTDWIVPTWSREYRDRTVFDEFEAFEQIRVGDLVRVGTSGTGGYTDYLTVLEKVTIDRLYNGTHIRLPVTRDPGLNVAKDGVSHSDDLATGRDEQNMIEPAAGVQDVLDRYYELRHPPRRRGIAHYALRLNRSIDCTDIRAPMDTAIKVPMTSANMPTLTDRLVFTLQCHILTVGAVFNAFNVSQ